MKNLQGKKGVCEKGANTIWAGSTIRYPVLSLNMATNSSEIHKTQLFDYYFYGEKTIKSNKVWYLTKKKKQLTEHEIWFFTTWAMVNNDDTVFVAHKDPIPSRVRLHNSTIPAV